MWYYIVSKMNYFERAKFFKTKKRLGQNFLINGEVIQDIINRANIQPDDTIVEMDSRDGLKEVLEKSDKFNESFFS